MSTQTIGTYVQTIGTTLLRYGLAAMLLMGGASKWTPAEAEAIRPWVSASPFLSWIYSIATVQGGSEIIGAIEVAAALLIVARHWLPRAAVVGSSLAIMTFVITLSFLFTTPHQSADAQGFLMKDFFLLGAAIWSTGEALHASRGARLGG